MRAEEAEQWRGPELVNDGVQGCVEGCVQNHSQSTDFLYYEHRPTAFKVYCVIFHCLLAFRLFLIRWFYMYFHSV